MYNRYITKKIIIETISFYNTWISFIYRRKQRTCRGQYTRRKSFHQDDQFYKTRYALRVGIWKYAENAGKIMGASKHSIATVGIHLLLFYLRNLIQSTTYLKIYYFSAVYYTLWLTGGYVYQSSTSRITSYQCCDAFCLVIHIIIYYVQSSSTLR